MSKRTGAPMLNTASPKRQRQDTAEAIETSADQPHMSRKPDLPPGANATEHFCKRCQKLDLPTLLTRETKARCIGLLERFDDPLCQLCDTVQYFVKMHWGNETPSVVNGCRPSVHMQSKEWCSISNSFGHRKFVYRIIPAVDQQPPNSPLTSQSSHYDNNAKFVLGEVEIDPTKVNHNIMLASIRRKIPPCIDLALVQSWLNNCQDHHEFCRDNRASQRLDMTELFYAHGFRLIDVTEGRLVEKTEPCKYVALSYVWGQAASFGLYTKKENLSTLCQPSSLDDAHRENGVLRRLPRTIADAILFCRSIGQRYLWVDSLCIVQDNQDEKRRLIHGMNNVYENADLTLVALCGIDADAGLAGMRSRGHGVDNCGREHLYHEGYGTCSIGIGRLSLTEKIQSSHWSTRGWTYQEELLSPRKLYFAPGELFYECKCQKVREGYAFENCSGVSVRPGAPWYGGELDTNPQKDTQPHKRLNTMPGSEPGEHWFQQSRDVEFQKVVSVYTRRHLKEPGDILHALTGVYNRFYPNSVQCGIGISAVQGLPMKSFGRALLWFTPKPCRTKRSDVSTADPSTWSWTYWVTPVDFACSRSPKIPSETKRIVHGEFGAFSLVEEWCLTFQKGDTITKERFPGRNLYDEMWISPDSWTMDATEFMNTVLRGHHDSDDVLRAPPIPGLLEFRGLYIPFPTPESSPTWSQQHERQWHLSFEGIEVTDIDLQCTAIALFDCDDTTLDGFVLLLYDWTFMGICVKKTGEHFERVGICMFTNYREDWGSIMEKGLLEMYWERIYLR